ncbi:histone deacetylase [Streptomyces sp. MST-110588]|uniref:histone deacetylase n=1 Tax=Streptomyces sp. MST-110588 TaxID=2833628 RepID=UPI001F5C8DD5|nr:histone deacetylase [Streptomyces sp. MST-110588]
MHAARLRCYLAGGRPTGGARTYPGCRDPRPPSRSVPAVLPGAVYFALESRVWTGGMAFYDPDGPGEVWARAHLVTAGQFCDIAAQEMHRMPEDDAEACPGLRRGPGLELDLSAVVARGRVSIGPGRYETLVCPGMLDGRPMLTFTAPWGAGDVTHNRPSARYLAHLTAGLREAGAWDEEQIAGYLARCRSGEVWARGGEATGGGVP